VGLVFLDFYKIFSKYKQKFAKGALAAVRLLWHWTGKDTGKECIFELAMSCSGKLTQNPQYSVEISKGKVRLGQCTFKLHTYCHISRVSEEFYFLLQIL